MSIERRTFLAGTAALAAAGPSAAVAARGGMYGLIGRMSARAGPRGALTATLVDGVARMPGCLSYVIAHDAAGPDVIWITEIWVTKKAHATSLAFPSVRAAIAKARSLIAAMEVVAEMVPVGGSGVRDRG